MLPDNFHRNNHYLPRLYLKRWKPSSGKVFVYRTLASHEKVPLWSEQSIGSIAVQEHLYTNTTTGNESDEIEKWFDSEYESPAEEVIQRVVSNQSLSVNDWKILIRFLALQDVRTPARLLEHLAFCEKNLPRILQDTMDKAVQKFQDRKSKNIKSTPAARPADFLPMRVTTELKPGEEMGTLRVETIGGRGSWLFNIRHILQKTAPVLQEHKWTILSPAEGMTWFTSDKPVIRLNYNKKDQYDFGGGWGNPGSEILLPLSPHHLLYTQVGKKPPQRGTRLTVYQTTEIRRFIAEHAHRIIFAAHPDPEMSVLAPRTVDAEKFRDEEAQWARWHSEQASAEKELITTPA